MKALLFCYLLSAASTSLAAPVQYSARQDITTGFTYLYGMAVADFNGDGKPDIAATDNGAKNIVVYLNDGKGSFGAPKSTPISMSALGPGSIIAADFNEDGKQDIVVGTVAGSQGTILLAGNGDGTFTQQSDLPNAFGFITGTAVDVNRDSHLDLILSGNLYLGDGRGNFQSQTFPTPGSSFITGIATGDFNKDNKLDFVTASPLFTPGVQPYLGLGDGTFTSTANLVNSTISSPASVAVADFNNDGNADLLTSSPFLAYLILGNGDGTFDLANAQALPSIPYSGTFSQNSPPVAPYVVAADIDGDAKIDAIVANPYSTALGLFLNDGTGRFPQSLANLDYAIDRGTSQLATADLNGDGLPDFILANNTTQKISIYLSMKPKMTPAIALTSSAASQFIGSSVNITVEVTEVGSDTPTGTVTLMEENTTLSQQTLDAGGQAVFSLSNLPAGQHTIIAVYSGDSNHNAISSSAITQYITDMQVAIPTASQTVSAGGTAAYTLNITPIAGLSGSATISCSQLPTLATCDPVTITLTGQPLTATLNVRTTSPVRSQNSAARYAFAFAPFLIIFCASERRRSTSFVLTTLAVCLVSVSLIGCSSGSSTPSKSDTPGTPSGTTAFTITSTVTAGNQTLTRSATATLIVQ